MNTQFGLNDDGEPDFAKAISDFKKLNDELDEATHPEIRKLHDMIFNPDK